VKNIAGRNKLEIIDQGAIGLGGLGGCSDTFVYPFGCQFTTSETCVLCPESAGVPDEVPVTVMV
jgi:hypothetical protein